MLEIRDLYKHFGSVKAVQGISFDVARGEVLGFLGPNGAGKTTTMRMITGFLPPDRGSASVCGHNVVEDPVAAKSKIGYLPENAPAYPSMTVNTFLRFAAEIRGYRGDERDDRLEQTVRICHLQKVRHRAIANLSKGYRQRVCFAQAILHDPPVLIMDEPTDGLDPNQKHVVRTMIRDMAAEKAIIVSTHILEEVDAVCTRAIIISNGKVVANGTPESLKDMSETRRMDDVFRMLTLGKEGAKDA